MASLRLRRGVYYLQWCLGGRIHRRSLKTDSFQVARELQRQFESARQCGTDSPLPTSTPLAQVLQATLNDDLRQRGVTQVFLTGIATSIGVESTARSAYDHGYNVALVVDAMTDRDAESHRHSVEKIFPRLGEVINADDVLKRLKERPRCSDGTQ